MSTQRPTHKPCVHTPEHGVDSEPARMQQDMPHPSSAHVHASTQLAHAVSVAAPQASCPQKTLSTAPCACAQAGLTDQGTPCHDVLHMSLYIRPSVESVAFCAATLLAERCAEAIARRGVFTLGLSGGSTPLPLFRLLRSFDWQTRFDWERVHVFWVDERCVPESHPASNSGTAKRELLDHLLAVGGVYPMPVEHPEAAHLYTQTLREHVPNSLPTKAQPPRLDCLLLGMGADGHTASLFPNAPLLEATDQIVATAQMPHAGTPDLPEHQRLTLTLPVLNAARCCLFMATGADKRPMTARALHLLDAPELPVQRVRPCRGEVIWVMDKAAAEPSTC